LKLWNDLGIHVNRKDSENSTPNIDYLAYSGTILNRFYANGGLDSLLSGCYQRSQYGNSNLMSLYFERNGYNVNFISRKSFDKIESFEKGVLDAISKSDNRPFLAVADFGLLGPDSEFECVSIPSKISDTITISFLFSSVPPSNQSKFHSSTRLSLRL
jgi:hypothetical protein